jgi:hypothetical protein
MKMSKIKYVQVVGGAAPPGARDDPSPADNRPALLRLVACMATSSSRRRWWSPGRPLQAPSS